MLQVLKEEAGLKPSTTLPYKMWALEKDINVKAILGETETSVPYGSIMFFYDEKDGGMQECFDATEWRLLTPPI